MTCALCLLEKPLVGSHLLPHFLFGQIRDQGAPRPLLIENGRAVLTDKEPRQPLLCEGCDNGEIGLRENRVAPMLCPDREGMVPMVHQLGPALDTIGKIVHHDAGSVDVGLLEYFSLSILWKYAAAKRPNCQLGSYYEPLRQYLRGAELPREQVSVTAMLYLNESRALQVSFGAHTRREGRHHSHIFVTGGLCFLVAIGRQIPDEIRRWSMGEGYVNVCPDPTLLAFGKEITAAKPAGKAFLRYLRERSP